MTSAAWLQVAALIGLLLVGTRLLGPYMARVYGGGPAPGDRVFLPLERLAYRLGRIEPEREQPWHVYARSVLAFSLISVLGLYALQRLQGLMPLNPTHVRSVPPELAFNTAVSFVTNTNWQNYARRVDDEPPRPDEWSDGPELRLRRGRHVGGDRPGPRPQPSPG